MIWLNPAAWIGLLALSGPIVIHVLVQRRAERLPFPSLRFLQQTRLASIRRHVLEDLLLLAIRSVIVVAAVAALAGPLVITPSQRREWNARIVRATVVNVIGGERPPANDAPRPQPDAFQSRRFNTSSIRHGIVDAIRWFAEAPPARREIVIVGPLALGSVTADDVALVPVAVGLRFERSGTLPAERTVTGGLALVTERDGFSRAIDAVIQQTVTVKGAATSVNDTAVAGTVPFPIEVVCAADARPAVNAAIAATRSERVWTPAANHRGRLVILDPSLDSAAIEDPRPIGEPWMADALASIASDRDLQSEATALPAGLKDARYRGANWRSLLAAANGEPLVVAASSASGLVVVSGAGASTLVTPMLLRAMANAFGGSPDLRAAEVLPIPDAQLQAWSRPALPVATLRPDRVERDNRRSLWVFVLALLALEAWIRRSKVRDASEPFREDARVA